MKKRILYIFAALAILTGCSVEEASDENDLVIVKSASETVDSAQHGSSNSLPIEVSKFAGKPESDVTALLGKPTATENGEWTSLSTEEKTPYVRHTYKTDTGEVSVMFIEGVAARIEVKPTETFKYPDDAIKAMRAAGLAVEDGATPERENPLYLDYGQVDGFYNVRVVKDVEGNPENVGYVKLVTESRFK